MKEVWIVSVDPSLHEIEELSGFTTEEAANRFADAVGGQVHRLPMGARPEDLGFFSMYIHEDRFVRQNDFCTFDDPNRKPDIYFVNDELHLEIRAKDREAAEKGARKFCKAIAAAGIKWGSDDELQQYLAAAIEGDGILRYPPGVGKAGASPT